MSHNRIFRKCLSIAFISIAASISVGVGVNERSDENSSSPFFKIESTKSYNVWADPQYGVWTSRAGLWSSSDLTKEESRKSIESNWPNGGLSDFNYEPILNDKRGGIWFFAGSTYNDGIPYAHYDSASN